MLLVLVQPLVTCHKELVISVTICSTYLSLTVLHQELVLAKSRVDETVDETRGQILPSRVNLHKVILSDVCKKGTNKAPT